MAKKTRAQLKQGHARAIKIQPAGPSNVTRGAGVLGMLNDLADSALLEEDLSRLGLKVAIVDGGGPGFQGPRTINPFI